MKVKRYKSSEILEQPLYVQIAEKVEGLIGSRGLRPHDLLPSETELARCFDVSRMTAKLALDLLARRQLVYRLARRGTFVAEASGRETQTSAAAGAAVGAVPAPLASETIRIAFVVSNIDYYTGAILSAFEQEARLLGFKLELRLSRDAGDEDAIVEQLADEGADGIVLFPRGREQGSAAVRKLKAANFPIVAIDRQTPGVACDCVLHDHFQGAYEMVARLIAAGHKEIAYVTNPFTGISSIEERYRGYMKALYDHDIGLLSQHIYIIDKANSQTDYTQPIAGLDQFLHDNAQITAVMCGDDYLAAAVMYAAFRLGRQVPGELSIAGFTNSQLATMLPVPLTTVSQPVVELVRSAVALILKRIHQGESKPATIKIKTAIVERQSVSVRRDRYRLNSNSS
jgi:GntR family transcriptional regulator of arabinose operon